MLPAQITYVLIATRANANNTEIEALKARCVEMAHEQGILAQMPAQTPLRSCAGPTSLEVKLTDLESKLREKDIEISALRTRLTEALQLARQGRPLSGEPIVPMSPLPHRNIRSARGTPTNPATVEPFSLSMRIQQLETEEKAHDVKTKRLEELMLHSQRRVASLEAELQRVKSTDTDQSNVKLGSGDIKVRLSAHQKNIIFMYMPSKGIKFLPDS